MLKKHLKVNLIVLSVVFLLSIGATKANEPYNNQPSKQPVFEGVITTKISLWGLDLSPITESIDYSKGNIRQQMKSIYVDKMSKEFSVLESKLDKNPMMGMALLLLPPKGYLYIKDKEVIAKTKGLGYQLQHYHNLQSDEAFIYTSSLINPTEAVTSSYTPSKGYKELFGNDKYINAENYTIQKSPKKVNVAGYDCSVNIYTANEEIQDVENAMGIPTMNIHKLVVYSTPNLPNTINFSHPYYIPEDNGIIRIDIYLDKSNEPAIVYEATSIEKKTIEQEVFKINKATPVYELMDMEYAMKLMTVMFGGFMEMQ